MGQHRKERLKGVCLGHATVMTDDSLMKGLKEVQLEEPCGGLYQAGDCPCFQRFVSILGIEWKYGALTSSVA